MGPQIFSRVSLRTGAKDLEMGKQRRDPAKLALPRLLAVVVTDA